MSWQKCDDVEAYSLAIPASLTLMLGVLHLWAGVSVFALELPADAAVLMALLVVRSWRQVQSEAGARRSLRLSIDRAERIVLHEELRNSFTGGASARIRDRFARRDLQESAAFGGAQRRPPPMREGDLVAAAADSGRGAFKAASPSHDYDAEEYRETRAGLEQTYTVRRSVRLPGCIHATLRDVRGKHLEILVFYRYDQRQIYRRLWRFFVLQ